MPVGSPLGVPGSLVGVTSTTQEIPIPRRLQDFFETEAAGGIVLLAAAVVALVWVNSPFAGSYHHLWETELSFRVGGFRLEEDLRHWVNEALMAIFFLVVGLEIKRELVTGELRTWRHASLPAIAALGGMVVPALLYLAVAGGGPGRDGWGIPMATDIAFALGVLALLGRRVPTGLKLFLLALAIVDDIGAIVVIAVFYAADVQPLALAVAVALVGVVVVLRIIRVAALPVYVVLGAAVWLATFRSGVHATIAGVVLGLLAPARATTPDATPPAERLEQTLHPFSSLVIVPVFALANAGVALDAGALGDAAGRGVALGVGVGLVVGKLVGVSLGALVAVRLGLGTLPDGVGWRHVVGAAGLAGIGFTVSLFVTDLAFADPGLQSAAKVGILAASALASVIGVLVLATRPAR